MARDVVLTLGRSGDRGQRWGSARFRRANFPADGKDIEITVWEDNAPPVDLLGELLAHIIYHLTAIQAQEEGH